MENVLLKLTIFVILISIVSTRSIYSQIPITSNAIASLIDNFSEKHYARFIFVVEKDHYLERLADNVMKTVKSPLLVKKINSGETLILQLEFSYFFLCKIKKLKLEIRKSKSNYYRNNKFIKIKYIKSSYK